jgi:hypothetical protein
MARCHPACCGKSRRVVTSGASGRLDSLICRASASRLRLESIMPKKPPFARGRKRCIFCEAFGVSKEHVLGDWLKEIFPRTPVDTHMTRATTWGQSAHGKIYAMPVVRIENGHASTRKVRFVCEPCNNEWMSGLETAIQPIIMPLIAGFAAFMSVEQQKILATWIAKTVMAAEYIYPDQIAISQEQRHFLMTKQEPPPGWAIVLADYNGNKWRHAAIAHHVLRSNPAPIGPREPFGGRDTQLTCIGIGHLFIQTASTTFERYSFGLKEDEGDAFRQIWPLRAGPIFWPPSLRLDDNDADFLASTLSRAFGVPHVP